MMMRMRSALRVSPPAAAAVAHAWRSFASASVGTDLVSAAPDVSLQKARTWDEGVSSKFSTTPLKDLFRGKKVVIFGLPSGTRYISLAVHDMLWLRCVLVCSQGAFTGVCSAQHVPSYKNNIDKFKAKGIDSVICVAVNDPYVMNGWAEKLQAKEAIEFYGDFDGSFHKSMELNLDLSGALLGHRSQRWSAYVVDGKIQVLNVEKVPSEFQVSGGEVILGQI
ncbi:putative peroxiredoxin-2F, mitochondrial [Iris pallida]|uniref:Glutaredoxin-dependent peroxiredoxin n=1 Tax=Iris pallida TaxID=29817 RepID=A0AAX6EYD5_IRIPA|nr:putative peroxiredoxin-2F, mitochondrial [Iris pallida]KAJ6808755.1 putative peroxiredoxin-2F, mitochondrial [Iris pallida]